LKVESFQNIEATTIPAVLPWEGSIPEKPSIYFLPYLPEDECNCQIQFRRGD
jgi:hypothetical protein